MEKSHIKICKTMEKLEGLHKEYEQNMTVIEDLWVNDRLNSQEMQEQCDIITLTYIEKLKEFLMTVEQ